MPIPNTRVSPVRPLSWSRDRQGNSDRYNAQSRPQEDANRTSTNRDGQRDKGKGKGKKGKSRSPVRRFQRPDNNQRDSRR